MPFEVREDSDGPLLLRSTLGFVRAIARPPLAALILALPCSGLAAARGITASALSECPLLDQHFVTSAQLDFSKLSYLDGGIVCDELKIGLQTNTSQSACFQKIAGAQMCTDIFAFCSRRPYPAAESASPPVTTSITPVDFDLDVEDAVRSDCLTCPDPLFVSSTSSGVKCFECPAGSQHNAWSTTPECTFVEDGSATAAIESPTAPTVGDASESHKCGCDNNPEGMVIPRSTAHSAVALCCTRGDRLRAQS